MSTPRSHNGDMVFLLKSQKGFTRRIMTSANDSAASLLPRTKNESNVQQDRQSHPYGTLINGPYGGSHSDFAAFDSICLLAGSTGITFTLAILQGIADRVAAAGKRLPVRRIHFVWCIKDTSWARWCNEEILAAVAKLRKVGIQVIIDIHVTCADAFTEQNGDAKECGCQCDKSLGPCCCVIVDDTDEVKETSQGDGKHGKEGEVITLVSGSDSSKLSILPSADFHSGRPSVRDTLEQLLDSADGESGIAVCGPIGLSCSVRNSLVQLSDERAIHKGSGAQGCYLHVESFS